MEKRIKLVSDINNFIEKATIQHSFDGTIDKAMYFLLLKRISEINENDFDNLEKYNHFLKFLNEPDRRMHRNWVGKAFDENNLEQSKFYILKDGLAGISNWLGK